MPSTSKSSGRLIKGKTLGRGTYGTVYQANFFPITQKKTPFITNSQGPKSSDFGLNESTAVAVKRNIVDSHASFLVPVRELSILTQLRHHPFIVKLKTVSFGNPFATSTYTNVVGNYRYNSVALTPIPDKTLRDDNLYFIFEEAAYDGHTFIYGHNFSYGYIKLAMVQMLLAMEFIHSKGIIHRDLKPSNFLIFKKNEQISVKISDFGLSKYITNQSPSTPRTVTAWYRAPEIVCRWKNYGPSIDMWSIGCIFYELIARRALFYRIKDERDIIFKTIHKTLPHISAEDMFKVDYRGFFRHIYQDMREEKKNNEWPFLLHMDNRRIESFNKAGVNNVEQHGTFDQFIDLLSKLLEPHPEKRLTAGQALDHDFFSEFRNYINDTRSLHPPQPDSEPLIKIVGGRERSIAASMLFFFFNNRDKFDKWYTHRIVFQALDIFDRYLVWLDEIRRKNGLPNKYSDTELQVRFLVCTYLAIKLLTTTRLMVSFEDICRPFLKGNQYLSLAETFEIDLIQEILEFKIYRLTIYEAADRKNHILSEKEIRSLLIIHGLVGNIEGSPSELLSKYLIGDFDIPDTYREIAGFPPKPKISDIMTKISQPSHHNQSNYNQSNYDQVQKENNVSSVILQNNATSNSIINNVKSTSFLPNQSLSLVNKTGKVSLPQNNKQVLYQFKKAIPSSAKNNIFNRSAQLINNSFTTLQVSNQPYLPQNLNLSSGQFKLNNHSESTTSVNPISNQNQISKSSLGASTNLSDLKISTVITNLNKGDIDIEESGYATIVMNNESNITSNTMNNSLVDKSNNQKLLNNENNMKELNDINLPHTDNNRTTKLNETKLIADVDHQRVKEDNNFLKSEDYSHVIDEDHTNDPLTQICNLNDISTKNSFPVTDNVVHNQSEKFIISQKEDGKIKVNQIKAENILTSSERNIDVKLDENHREIENREDKVNYNTTTENTQQATSDDIKIKFKDEHCQYQGPVCGLTSISQQDTSCNRLHRYRNRGFPEGESLSCNQEKLECKLDINRETQKYKKTSNQAIKESAIGITPDSHLEELSYSNLHTNLRDNPSRQIKCLYLSKDEYNKLKGKLNYPSSRVHHAKHHASMKSINPSIEMTSLNNTDRGEVKLVSEFTIDDSYEDNNHNRPRKDENFYNERDHKYDEHHAKSNRLRLNMQPTQFNSRYDYNTSNPALSINLTPESFTRYSGNNGEFRHDQSRPIQVIRPPNTRLVRMDEAGQFKVPISSFSSILRQH